MAHSNPQLPPRLAEALLSRLVPKGTSGLTILGDLRQEYRDLVQEGSARFPRVWYWSCTLSVGGRYALIEIRRRLAVPGHGDNRTKPMSAFSTDLHYGLRMLTKTPMVSTIAILTIALGVAITTHSFSMVYGSLLRGVPVPGADRLVHIDANRPELGIESTEMSIHDFRDLRDLQTSFDDVAAFYQTSVNLAGEEGPPERLIGALVSDNALSHLEVPPLMGRTFLPGEDAPDASPVAVLGYHVWQNRFAGDPDIVGKSITVNGEHVEVVGIMPEGFRFPFREDLWLPHRIDAAHLARGSGPRLEVYGKLNKGQSLEAAREELETLAKRLAERFPDTNTGQGMGVEPFELRYMPAEVRAVMWVMLMSTFGVLLIACANVSNLLLARASVRTREVAVRTALGASRGRVIRQLMVESAILALLGGMLGLALSACGVSIMNGLSAGIYKPYWIDVRVDIPVLLFAVGVTAAASVAAGAFPAIKASGVEVGSVLRDESRTTAGSQLGRFSSTVVIAEIAASCCLLIGAGFLIKSVINLRNVDLGFDPAGVITGRIAISDADYPDRESRGLFLNDLLQKMEAEPGVESAALGTHLPALGAFQYHIGVEGRSYSTDRDYPLVFASAVTPDFFRVLDVEFLRGRDFTSLEARTGSDPVVIVSESFAETFLDGGDALGKRIRRRLSDSEEPWMTVVGVVPDMHVGGGVGGLGDDRRRPERIFVPLGLFDYSSYAILAASQRTPEALAHRMRETVAALDPNLPVFDITPLANAITKATWAFGQFGLMFTIFGIAALFLAAVGLYGVMAFSVGQRRKEMGIRIALGAQQSSIVRLVLRKGALQLLIGMAVGLVVGAAMGQPLRYVLFGVETSDATVYASVIVALVTAGFLACLVPARAATRADPVEAIRGGER